jgi:hypothetical protein
MMNDSHSGSIEGKLIDLWIEQNKKVYFLWDFLAA